MTTKYYRELVRGERIAIGDEWFDRRHYQWKSTKLVNTEVKDGKYRRPLSPQPFVPQWRHPEAPSVPVHVVWSETPPGVATVASVASKATPAASKSIPEPGDGYRLLKSDELIAVGDEFYGYGGRPWGNRWATVGRSVGERVSTWRNVAFRRKLPAAKCPIAPPAGYVILGPDEIWQEGDKISAWPGSWTTLASFNYGKSTKSWGSYDGGRWCCRKIKVVPRYRPYANADEAAKALEGKLIKHECYDNYYLIAKIDENGVYFSSSFHYFRVLTEYRFTDGTPCGVLVNE
jgi:hypothetical protein